jgi:DNA adenine methylase
MTAPLKSPFPWFGGKSRAAPLIWERFGDPANFVEPFAGSLAVLLGRPTPPRIETVNDLDCFVANFWRSLKSDPAGVTEWASDPVNEADLHARHLWLVNRDDFRERMKTDPDFFDVKVAGWWVWGQCSWIGSGWCRNAGMGVNRQLPHVGDAGRGVRLAAYLGSLSARLDRVRVCCGEWDRVLGPSVTFRHGTTAVLLDPPYADEAGRQGELYATDDGAVAHKVREWALANGDNPGLRIALCGYEGEHAMPDSWACVEWKAKGGYSSQNREGTNLNPERERVWFSPGCIDPTAACGPLFRRPEVTTA